MKQDRKIADAEISSYITTIRGFNIEQQIIAAAVIAGMNLQAKINLETVNPPNNTQQPA